MFRLSSRRYDFEVKFTFEGRHEGLPDCAKAPRKVDLCVPVSARRPFFAAAFLLCITWCWIPLLAQSHPSEGRASVEDRWIVLVDVSASLDQMDRQLNREVKRPNYRLRNELLSLLQVFLGAMDDADTRRNGFLKVEFFGDGVEAASGLPTWPLHWEDARNEDWWSASVPHSLSGRTEFMPALTRAADEFATMTPLARKHLLIVSDGELDVGPLDRNRGVPFGAEERKAYAELVSPDNAAVAKLRRLNVKVDAIVMDPLVVGTGSERQETVRKKLLSTGEPTIQRQFQKLLDDLEKEIASTGGQPYSEGPYFLHALTEIFGGQSRPVHSGNLGDVVWHTVFPEAERTRNVAPGSRWFVVVARTDEPVRLCFDQNKAGPALTLRYNRETNDYFREPSDSTADVRVRYHATSGYVTWLINASAVTCVHPSAAYYGNNVELRWLKGDKVFAGGPLPIGLELTRWSDPGPSLEWWRGHMAQRISSGSVKATANVNLPDGSRALGIPLKVETSTNVDSVLVLKGQLSRADSQGSYVVSVRLVDDEQGWEETIEPESITVAPESWWPAGPGAPKLAIAVGGLLCFSLLLVYRDQLKDFSSVPKAPFDFAIQNAGTTTFTKLGQRKTIRFEADDDGIRVSIGRRGVGKGPTAVFAPADRSSLNYRLCGSGHGWEYRQILGGKMSGEFVPLGERGVEISFLYFVQRSTVDLRHGNHLVRISHSSYIS
jgi:hypothetical protein